MLDVTILPSLLQMRKVWHRVSSNLPRITKGGVVESGSQGSTLHHSALMLLYQCASGTVLSKMHIFCHLIFIWHYEVAIIFCIFGIGKLKHKEASYFGQAPMAERDRAYI